MHKPRRSLSLAREALTELTPGDLGAVAAGGVAETFLDCLATVRTDQCCHAPTMCGPCPPTIPVNRCLSLDGSCPR